MSRKCYSYLLAVWHSPSAVLVSILYCNSLFRILHSFCFRSTSCAIGLHCKMVFAHCWIWSLAKHIVQYQRARVDSMNFLGKIELDKVYRMYIIMQYQVFNKLKIVNHIWVWENLHLCVYKVE